MKRIINSGLALSILSGILLSIGWLQLSIGWVVLFAFVPILFLFHNKNLKKLKHKALHFSFYAFICFIVLNSITTYWIYKATIPGVIAVILISSALMTIVMLISYKVSDLIGKRIGLIVFVTNWVAFEYLFMNSQLSWPWLVLGNAFADNVSLIQWYEFTGHFGGSIWVLVINVLIYLVCESVFYSKNRKIFLQNSIILLVVFFVPIGYSLIRYYTYKERINPVSVVVIQPNIDPYNEKFSTPVQDQLEIITEIAEQFSNSGIDYYLAPETAITYGIWENDLQNNNYIRFIRSFLNENSDCKFIIGANTIMKYPKGKNKSETATESGSSGDYFDIYNSSLQIDTSSVVLIYHKSKLVPGIEMLPYPKVFGFLKDIMLDLGGMTGSHGTQNERTVFENKKLNISAAVPICYESVYGEFITEFVSNGANVLFIITNDGWWGNTIGYKQHLGISRLRAIETRRSIARCANTGISCIIDQKGDIIKSLGWWQRGAICENINTNNEITFYVKHGDYLARMSLVVSALSLLMSIGHLIGKKFNKRD